LAHPQAEQEALRSDFLRLVAANMDAQHTQTLARKELIEQQARAHDTWIGMCRAEGLCGGIRGQGLVMTSPLKRRVA
jgi:hypothetical protein